MVAAHVLAFVAGVAILVATGSSILFTLVIPRANASRISTFVGRRVVRGAFLVVARRFERFETKDRVLALAAPVALLSIFGAWLLLNLVAFGLMIWAISSASL